MMLSSDNCYQRLERVLETVSPAADPAQKKALEFFKAEGLPDFRNEEWRYTSLNDWQKQDFLASTGVTQDVIDLKWLSFEQAGTLVFNQGKPDLTLSTLGEYLKVIDSQQFTTPPLSPFSWLNRAFSPTMVVLTIPDNTIVDHPIVIVNHNNQDTATLAAPRVQIRLGKGAKAEVIEIFEGSDSDLSNTLSFVDIHLSAGAQLQHAKLSTESKGATHFSETQLKQDAESHYVQHNLLLGGKLTHQTLVQHFAGERATCELFGLTALSGSAHANQLTQLHHDTTHCDSSQMQRNLLDGRARVIFNAKIIVQETAAKTNALMRNNNLLLSDTAEADTRPQLEIYNQDVKCAHGATSGHLDDEALFYLRSRGLTLKQATSFLLEAFANEIIDGVKNPNTAALLSDKVSATLDDLLKEAQ